MPRSYSFDHYTATKPDSSKHRRPERKGRKLQKPDVPESAQALHYGKQNAQTEQLYAAHAMEQQLEKLMEQDAGVNPPGEQEQAPSTPQSRAPTPEPETSTGQMKPPSSEALPSVSAVVDHAYARTLHDLQELARGVKTAFAAGKDLVGLPVDTARALLRTVTRSQRV